MTSDPHELKTLARGFSRDMTPDAISRRLEIVGELNKLCHYLGTATPAPGSASRIASQRGLVKAPNIWDALRLPWGR